MKNRLGILSLLFALAITTTPFMTPAVAGDTDAWVGACNANNEVTKRIGRLTSEEVLEAEAVLSKGSAGEKLGQLNLVEACLTVVATAAAQTPTFVVERSALQEPTLAVPGLPQLSTQQSIEQKLQKLDAGYWAPSGKAADPLWESSPRQFKALSRTAIAMEVYSRDRSYSASYQDHCVIIHDPKPLADYLSYTLAPELRDSLSIDDQEWLGQYGDAMEFWHEVGHCEYPLAANEKWQVQSDGLMRMHEALAGTGADSCGATSEPDEYGLTARELEPYYLDGAILIRLGDEAFADLYAKRKITERFGLQQPGCTGKPDDNSAWGQYRIAMSIFNPDMHYMTWLAPWIRGLPLPVQAQTMADAWDAVEEVAFEHYPHIQRPSMRRKMAESREKWLKPSQAPDAHRQDRWVEWLKQRLR